SRSAPALSPPLPARRVAAALATTALPACRVAALAATALATAEPALAAALTTATPARGRLRHQLHHLRLELVSRLAGGIQQLLSDFGQLLPIRCGQSRGRRALPTALAACLSPVLAGRLSPGLAGLTTPAGLGGLGPHRSQQ